MQNAVVYTALLPRVSAEKAILPTAGVKGGTGARLRRRSSGARRGAA